MQIFNNNSYDNLVLHGIKKGTFGLFGRHDILRNFEMYFYLYAVFAIYMDFRTEPSGNLWFYCSLCEKIMCSIYNNKR